MRNYTVFWVSRVDGGPDTQNFIVDGTQSANSLHTDQQIQTWIGLGYSPTFLWQKKFYFLANKSNTVGLFTIMLGHYAHFFLSPWTFLTNQNPRKTWSHGD